MSIFGKAKGGGRRSASRQPTPLIAVFTTVTRSDRATVVDISPTGVRLKGTRLPQAEEVLEVRIEHIRAFGAVVWSKDQECGIAFDRLLTPAELCSLRHGVAALAGLPPQIKEALDDWTTGFAR